MPPSGETGAAGAVRRLYPDLTQFYFSEGLQFGPADDRPLDNDSPYTTLLRPDYPIYPDLTELNITEEEVQEIAPDYPMDFPDNSNEDLDVVSSLVPDYDDDDDEYLASTVRDNLNFAEPKIINDKTIEFRTPRPHQPVKQEYNSWVKWRIQVNNQLVAMILMKHGKRVLMRRSEMTRKPLSKMAIRSVINDAHTDSRADTSLPARPYIMYGIPRVRLTGTAHHRCM